MTPEQLNAWRIIPRILMFAMIGMTYRTVEWFVVTRSKPGASGIGHVMTGALTGAFGLFLGKKSDLQILQRRRICLSGNRRNKLVPEFVERLDELREACNFPFHITSGYRSPEHSLKAKIKPGTHAQGIAADIHADNGIERRKIVEEALKLGLAV